MSNLLSILAERLEAGDIVVEAAVLGHGGSAPRTAGAGMLLFEDGSFAGTVGGGRLEADVQAAAWELFSHSQGAARFLTFDLSNDDAALSDMICGGRQDLFLHLVTPGATVIETYRAAGEELDAGRGVVMLHDLGPADDQTAPRVQSRWTLPVGGLGLAMPADLAPELIEQALKAATEGGVLRFEFDGRRWLALAHAQPGTLILFGAGHVSQKTAEIAHFTGFRVAVLDDRPEFANRERFPTADHIVTLPSFEEGVGNWPPVDANSYLVIVTRGHSHDLTVLGQALKTPAAYIGMIGSKKKRDAIYAALRKQGVDEAALARVHSPIGLPIGAETPEEIAISIVGELIRARALRRGTRKRV